MDVKATEKSRIMAETTDKTNCVQKLNHPNRLQAAAAFAKFFRAGSLMLADVTFAGGLLLGLPAAHITCRKAAESPRRDQNKPKVIIYLPPDWSRTGIG